MSKEFGGDGYDVADGRTGEAEVRKGTKADSLDWRAGVPRLDIDRHLVLAGSPTGQYGRSLLPLQCEDDDDSGHRDGEKGRH